MKSNMFGWYYVLWSDAINFTRSSVKLIGIWKIHTLGFISFFMAINIAMVVSIMGISVNTHFYKIFDFTSLNAFLGFITVFFVPPFILNYFLVFYKSKWEGIRKEYKHYNGRLYKWYFIISIVIPIFVLIIMKVFY